MKRYRVVLGSLVLLIIALAALLVACGGGKSNPMNPAPSGADVTITINGNLGAGSYSAGVCTVGQKVAWHNADGATHTATANGGAFNTGNIAGGATSAPITMTTAGSFPYHCLIHGVGMAGTLTVNP